MYDLNECLDGRTGPDTVTRNEIKITKITRLPWGREIAAKCRGIFVVKVCGPSGKAKRQDKERFYNCELPYIIMASPSNMIVGGDLTVYSSRQTALGT